MDQEITPQAPIPKPTIGRIVIYHGNPDAPALIVGVDSYFDVVSLAVFQPNTDKPVWVNMQCRRGTAVGQWSWPERVA